MKRSVLNKTGFVLAIAGAAVIGGATTALVQAAIPSSNDGQIHACYRNNAGFVDPKGALKVIDSDAGATCGSGETALNWSPSQQGGALLKDHNNQSLGTVVDLNESQNGKVFNDSINRLIPLEYDSLSSQYRIGQIQSPIYESSDCSGQPYADSGPALSKTHLFRWVDASDTTKYAIVPDNASQVTRTTQSIWSTEDGGLSYFCRAIAPEPQAVYGLSEINLPFTTPIALPLKF